MKHKPLHRILSALLCVATLVGLLPALSLSALGASTDGSGTDPVVSTDVETHDGIDYTVTRTTRYIGNRTYSVQVDISAGASTLEHSRVRTSSHNGYVTVEEDGYYLIELWGGDGGNGSESVAVVLMIPVPTDGGKGADGGYVYGKVFLRRGQTLVYNIGTHGDQSVVYNDQGGGVNGGEGGGGTHGDQGSLTVGGGGGYTSIYLFEEGEFDPSYVTDTSLHLPETARLSRYLMIAGGGGGGGAGYTNAITNGTDGAAHGGAGGNINNGVSLSLLGSDYAVPGYVFSGRNGQSSGTSTEYIGRGGSNVPGRVSSTLMGMYQQNQLPNDWAGTHNPQSAPGSGGSGNFRGGGGGSGYAGGSGGIMAAELLAAHIGGGGGGSSFIAQSVNGQSIEFLNLTASERQYLSGASAQPEGGQVGGAVQITYLGGEEGNFYQEALDNIALRGTVSRYFTLLGSSKTSGSAPISFSTEGDGTTTFTAAGLSVIPSSAAHTGKIATVTLFLRAKEDFEGGNAVPLFGTNSEGAFDLRAEFKSPNDNATLITVAPSPNKAQSYVNVPLLGRIRTKSYTGLSGKSYAVTSLYYDDYMTYRTDTDAYWQCDYIASFTSYTVVDEATGATVTGSVAPASTRAYLVSYQVTPKYAADPEITVGPAVKSPSTVSARAIISVVSPGTAELNGLNVTGTKSLAFADGVYDLSVLINQESSAILFAGTNSKATASGPWEAPTDGWYYIQVWGGNGGSSGSVSCSGVNGNDVRTASSASGGTGGYVTGYVYLAKGTALTLTVGSAGSTGGSNTGNRLSRANSLTTSRHEVYQSWAGGGGGYSAVELGGVPLMVAGGGGGAGSSTLTIAQWGVVYSQTASRAGGSVSNTTVSNTLAASLASYNGGNGSRNGSGSAGVALGIPSNMTATAGSAGSAGTNYRQTGLLTGYDFTDSGKVLPIEAEKYAATLSSSRSGSAGQVVITLVANDQTEEAYGRLMDLEAEVAVSRYFDVDASTVSLTTGDSYSRQTRTDNGDGSYTVTYTDAAGETVAKFTYRLTTASDGVSTRISITDVEYRPDPVTTGGGSSFSIHYESNLSFRFKLTPKEGFLGGNDVPLLAYSAIDGVADKDSLPDCGVRVIQGAEFMNLPAAGATDFANVASTVDLSPYLTVEDKTVRLGDSVEKSQLYTFTPPTYGAEAWEDDYATFVFPTDATYTPTKTDSYIITAGFAPRVPTAQKATIVESVPTVEYSLESTVYVEVPVTASLTNLLSDHPEWTLWGEDLGLVLTPKSGYILPDSVTVRIGGVETDRYTYNSTLGTLSIEGQYVTGPVEIEARADVRTYDIHIVYTRYDSALDKDVEYEETIVGIEADQPIDWTLLDTIEATVPAKPGHRYTWVYETEGGERPLTMPANHMWVYGVYEKAAYPLTVRYVYEGGAEAAPAYETGVVYGESYSVPSPAIKGYLPDQLSVTGVMGTEAVEITVTYAPSKNQLIILHQTADGRLLGQHVQATVTDGTYTVPSPSYEGYRADRDSVTVTMSGDDTETVIVTYTPKTYTVTFDYQSGGFDGATLDGESTRVVEYDQLYAYDAAQGTYGGLPIPQIVGYEFAGWYADAGLTLPVSESDTVKLTADTTLYAKWERAKFKLTVRYEFLYVGGDYVPEGFADAEAVQTYLVTYEELVEFGTEYSVSLPALVGYSSYENYGLNDQTKTETLTGIMPAQSKLLVITYFINTYEVRFEDKTGDYVTYSDAATSTVASDSFDTLWKTVEVKHDVSPVYGESEVTPHHDTTEHYTYVHTGWYGSADGVTYGGKTPDLPAATGDCSYYAMYTATENILSVRYGSTVAYFTDVASALVYAETYVASSVTLTFRRNAGNGTALNLDGDTLIFGNTYTGTTAYTVTVDLGGIDLAGTEGRPLLENVLRPLSVTVGDTVGGGSMRVEGEDALVIHSRGGSLTLNNSVAIEAVSATGNATAIRFGSTSDAYTLTMSATATVTATAEAGLATGIEAVGTSAVRPTTVTVLGRDAVGIRIAEGASLTLSGTSMALTVDGTSSARGIDLAEGATLTNNVSCTIRQQVSSDANAYGIYNRGTVLSVNLKMDVLGGATATGFYNDGGTLTVTGVGTGTDLRAQAPLGYGLYNGDATSIGSADGNKLNRGAFAGSTYGIYSATDNVYASGNFLYAKGADGDTAFVGVVHEGYQVTDATTQFEEGYYRLAAVRTIVFMTNEGTPIASVVQLYDTPLAPVVTTRQGYTFVSWHTAESLDAAYVYPTSMPDLDLVLYAQWSLNTYYYSMDKVLTPLTVNFYKTTPTSTSTQTLLSTVTLNEENLYLTLPADQTYVASYYVYVQSGWYTSATPSYATYVVFDGDMSRYDTDGDGVINLYTGWERNASMLYVNTSYAELGTDSSNPASAKITGSYDGNSNNFYMYYRVQVDGNYTFHLTNTTTSTNTYSRKYVYFYKGTPDSTLSTSSSYTNLTVSRNSSTSYTMTGLKAGDVIMLKIYRGYSSTSSSYDATISCYVSTTADLTSVEGRQAYIEAQYVPIEYNVTMGTVTLAPPVGRPGEKFNGWAEEGSSERVMQITPEMVDSVAQWQNGGTELWPLYSTWVPRVWDAYTSGSRDFTAFATADPVQIYGTETVSLRFEAAEMPTGELVFRFAEGLPTGTLLTLVDRTGEVPAYYTYTVSEGGVTELASTLFVRMGEAGVSFGGLATDVILQICYRGVSAPPAAESVSLYAGDTLEEVSASYTVSPVVAETEDRGEAEFTYATRHTVDLTLPADTGLPSAHRLFLRIRWEGVELAPGVTFSWNGTLATVYADGYALLDTGLTVAEVTAPIAQALYVDLSTMMQNEFTGATFRYELCAAPDSHGVFGPDVLVTLTLTETLTVKETASLHVTAGAVSQRVRAGDAVTLTAGTDDAEVYLYQQQQDGSFVKTPDCDTVFEGVVLDESGRLTFAEIEQVFINGTFTATVATTATAGKYYLVVQYGDKYERTVLQVIASN